MSDRGGYRIAVGGFALGLVAFLIGAAVVMATGHDVKPEYWSVGSAISGALLGILAPSPTTPKRAKAANAASAALQADAHARAVTSADQAAEAGRSAHAKEANEAAGKAHAAAADAHLAAAEKPAQLTGPLPLVALLLVFGFSLWAGIAENVTQLQALAAAAGGALVGLIVPSPGDDQGKALLGQVETLLGRVEKLKNLL